MEAKKSEKEKTENKRGTLFLIGFVVALSFAYITLEWSRSEVSVVPPDLGDMDIPEDIEIPITCINPPSPPPLPEISPDLFKPVDDDIIVDEVVIKTEDFADEGVSDIPKVFGNGPVGEIPEDEAVVIAEIMPRFDGNLNEYLSNNIKYPQIAIETNTQGRVTCQFIVNRDGSIVDVEVVRSVDPSLDREAVRVIKSMPKWRPGIQNGKPVRVKYFLPVNFKLM